MDVFENADLYINIHYYNSRLTESEIFKARSDLLDALSQVYASDKKGNTKEVRLLRPLLPLSGFLANTIGITKTGFIYKVQQSAFQ